MFHQATPLWTSGCGTGRNFPWLERAVTAAGHIVGVDLTDAMLREARHRVETAGWANVNLVESDVADYELPGNIGGVASRGPPGDLGDEATGTAAGVDGSFRSLVPTALWSEP